MDFYGDFYTPAGCTRNCDCLSVFKYLSLETSRVFRKKFTQSVQEKLVGEGAYNINTGGSSKQGAAAKERDDEEKRWEKEYYGGSRTTQRV